MKKILNLCAMFCATMLMVSCDPTDNPNGPNNPNNPNEPGNTPVIELENNGQISLDYKGGEVSVAYTIQNPAEGGELKVAVPEGNDWITATLDDTKVNFVITENETKDVRSEMIPLEYVYGEESVKAYINIIQEVSTYVAELELTLGECAYYGNMYSMDPNMYNYAVVLYTETQDAVVSLDLFADFVTDDYNVPAGEYVSCEAGDESGFALSIGDYAYLYKVNAAGTDYEYMAYYGMESSAVVTRDGNNVNIEAVLVDEESGDSYLVTFSGELAIFNQTVGSSLEEDFVKTYDAAELELFAGAGFAGTMNDAGVNYWRIEIQTAEWDAGQPIVYIELMTTGDVTVASPDFAGVYEVDPYLYVYEDYNDIQAGTVVPGMVGYYGTWAMEIVEMDGTQAYVQGAPITEGTVEIQLNEDGTYNFILEGVDDNPDVPHNVSVTINNVPLEAYEMQQQQMQLAGAQKNLISNKSKETRKL